MYELLHEKTSNSGFPPGLTQTWLYCHRRWLEAGDFRFRKKRYCTICGMKTKALISFTVTAKLICAFVFVYAKCWFCHNAAQFSISGNETFFFWENYFDIPALVACKNIVDQLDKKVMIYRTGTVQLIVDQLDKKVMIYSIGKVQLMIKR